MTYTGRVSVGGEPDVRRLPALTITKVAVGSLSNNSYLLTCVATGATLLVDAAAEPERLLELVPAGELSVFTTHRHADHWQALAAVVDATGARTLAGADDVDGIPTATDVVVTNGESVHFGLISLTAVTLRGHTPGSTALHYQDPQGTGHLFTGDSLFPGGVGKTPDEAAFAALMADVTDRLFGVYGDDTWFYPGHGDDSTLGAERGSLPEWRARGW